MPEGDWTATVKFSSEFPAANEVFYLALFQDKENWTAATNDPNYGGYPGWDHSLNIGLTWKSPAQVVGWPGELPKATSQPIYLRLQRAGHDFIASSRLESSEPDAWVTLRKIAELHVSGDLVLGFAQSRQGTGQTQAKVEWIKIETP